MKTARDLDVTRIDTKPQDSRGQVVWDNDKSKAWMYVKNVDTATAVANKLALRHDGGIDGNATPGTNALIDSVNTLGIAYGVWEAAIPQDGYGYVQVYGSRDSVSGTHTAGQPLVPNGGGTPDGDVAAAGAGISGIGYSVDGTKVHLNML